MSFDAYFKFHIQQLIIYGFIAIHIRVSFLRNLSVSKVPGPLLFYKTQFIYITKENKLEVYFSFIHFIEIKRISK